MGKKNMIASDFSHTSRRQAGGERSLMEKQQHIQ